MDDDPTRRVDPDDGSTRRADPHQSSTRHVGPDDSPAVHGLSPGRKVFGRYVLEAMAGRGGDGRGLEGARRKAGTPGGVEVSAGGGGGGPGGGAGFAPGDQALPRTHASEHRSRARSGAGRPAGGDCDGVRRRGEPGEAQGGGPGWTLAAGDPSTAGGPVVRRLGVCACGGEGGAPGPQAGQSAGDEGRSAEGHGLRHCPQPVRHAHAADGTGRRHERHAAVHEPAATDGGAPDGGRRHLCAGGDALRVAHGQAAVPFRRCDPADPGGDAAAGERTSGGVGR